MGRWKEIAWTKAEIETLREVCPRKSKRVILERLPKVMVCFRGQGEFAKNQEIAAKRANGEALLVYR